jgi:hypothetical protein
MGSHWRHSSQMGPRCSQPSARRPLADGFWCLWQDSNLQLNVAVRGVEVHPGVAAVVDPGLKEDLHAGGPKLGGRVLSSTRNPATGPVVKWRLIGLSGPKTSTLLPSGSLSIQNPGWSSSRRRQRTSHRRRRRWGLGCRFGPDPGQLDDPHRADRRGADHHDAPHAGDLHRPDDGLRARGDAATAVDRQGCSRTAPATAVSLSGLKTP